MLAQVPRHSREQERRAPNVSNGERAGDTTRKDEPLHNTMRRAPKAEDVVKATKIVAAVTIAYVAITTATATITHAVWLTKLLI